MTFQWGALIFKGAMTNLTCAYKVFRPDGEPIRADVKLTLKQAAATIMGQNPTTRAQAGFAPSAKRAGGRDVRGSRPACAAPDLV